MKQQGLSQEDLANAIQKSQGTVSLIVNGRVPVDIDTISQIADALSIDLLALILEQDEWRMLDAYRKSSAGTKSAAYELMQLLTRRWSAHEYKERSVNLVASIVELIGNGR